MRTVTNVGNYYTCNSPNCCHPSCWETIRKLMNGILIFRAKNYLWKRIDDSGNNVIIMVDQEKINITDIPYQLIYDSFAQSIFSDSQYAYRSPRLTNYAYFMMEKLKRSHIENRKIKEGELINEDNQDIKIDEECVKNSEEHLIALNLLKNQLKKWNHIEHESQLKSPYVWIPSKKLDKLENKPVKQKRSKQKGNGNLLFMLASKPEKCRSFVRQISSRKKDANQTLVSDYKIKRNEQNDVFEETSCMPRWMISCHISEHALRARLLPLARAQIRRHIQQGSLILCPSTSNIESDRRSEKRIPDSKVSLTKISEDVCGFEGDDQQMLVLYEQDELKAKSHLLSDLLLFQQSRLKRSEPTPSHYYMSSVDNLQSLYMNRCYTSPINWPSLLPKNSELKETSYNLGEMIPSSSSQEKYYTNDIIQSRNLLENENSLSNINDSFENGSNSVAIWQIMPGRLLRRSKTQYILNKSQQLKNDQICTDNLKQTKNKLKLNFMIENVNNQHHRKKSLDSNVINGTSEVELLRPTEDTHERDNDDFSENSSRFNNSYWSSRRHPGYIERMHTIGSVSDRKRLLQDNNSKNNNDRNYIALEKYKFVDSVNLITLKPKTKSFLPQIRHSVSTEKHWNKNILGLNSFDLTDQTNHSSSLPMLIKPPPPSPDVKFLDFS
ncbi:unnamed protein product [Schistosoma curassoni]|uniref:Protein kinase domain-containing protein n=1 Tax=Schistosoma curassoni TaxID=6186 RepID=A0A183KBC4_9TREM|nr:unnamed protein product [Schistosoma curassoni]